MWETATFIGPSHATKQSIITPELDYHTDCNENAARQWPRIGRDFRAARPDKSPIFSPRLKCYSSRLNGARSSSFRNARAINRVSLIGIVNFFFFNLLPTIQLQSTARLLDNI